MTTQPEWLTAMRADAYRKMLDDDDIARLTAIDGIWKLFALQFKREEMRSAFYTSHSVAMLVANQSMLIYHYAHTLIDHNLSGLMPERIRRKLWLDVQEAAEKLQRHMIDQAEALPGLYDKPQPEPVTDQDLDNMELLAKAFGAPLQGLADALDLPLELTVELPIKPISTGARFPANTCTIPNHFCGRCSAARLVAPMRLPETGTECLACAECVNDFVASGVVTVTLKHENGTYYKVSEAQKDEAT